MSSALLALLLVASPVAQQTFAVRPGSTLSYHLVHKFHAVTGVSRSVEGRARLLPDGTAQVMVRAPLDSFDSGNGNRDAHMLEVTGAAASPYVVFKGIGKLEPPTSFPAEVDVPLRGELTLKTARPVEVTARLRFEAPERVSVSTTFPISLEDHQVERPSLVFVKVDDRVDVEVHLTLEAER